MHAPNSTLEQSEWTSRLESNDALFQALNRAWTKRFTASGEYSWYIDKCMKRVGRLCESTGTADRDEAERYLLHQIGELRDIAIYGVRPRRKFHEAAAKYLTDFARKSTVRRDAAALKDLKPYIGDLWLDQISNDFFNAYRNARQDLSIITRNGKIGGRPWDFEACGGGVVLPKYQHDLA